MSQLCQHRNIVPAYPGFSNLAVFKSMNDEVHQREALPAGWKVTHRSCLGAGHGSNVSYLVSLGNHKINRVMAVWNSFQELLDKCFKLLGPVKLLETGGHGLTMSDIIRCKHLIEHCNVSPCYLFVHVAHHRFVLLLQLLDPELFRTANQDGNYRERQHSNNDPSVSHLVSSFRWHEYGRNPIFLLTLDLFR